jgi:hypothetical protein
LQAPAQGVPQPWQQGLINGSVVERLWVVAQPLFVNDPSYTFTDNQLDAPARDALTRWSIDEVRK